MIYLSSASAEHSTTVQTVSVSQIADTLYLRVIQIAIYQCDVRGKSSKNLFSCHNSKNLWLILILSSVIYGVRCLGARKTFYNAEGEIRTQTRTFAGDNILAFYH